MLDRLFALAVLAALAWIAYAGMAVYERFSARGRLEAAYWRALRRYGEGSPEATAARDAVVAHWASLRD